MNAEKLIKEVNEKGRDLSLRGSGWRRKRGIEDCSRIQKRPQVVGSLNSKISHYLLCHLHSEDKLNVLPITMKF